MPSNTDSSVTEASAQAQLLSSLRDAPLYVILRDGLLPLHASRSAAYGRLNASLRTSLAHPQGTERGDEGEGTRRDEYPAVCANCTEDLKLASEGVQDLVRLCEVRAKKNLGARACSEGHEEAKREASEFQRVAESLRSLQRLEEERMIAVVSVHAIKRANSVGDADEMLARMRCGGSDSGADCERETLDQKVVRFSKKLQTLDNQVEEIVTDAREIVFDGEEGEGE